MIIFRTGVVAAAAFMFGANAANAMSGVGTVCTNNINEIEAKKCLESTLNRSQGELKKKYAAVDALMLMRSGTPHLEERLARSQRTWELYVEQTCNDLIGSATLGSRVGYADVLSCKVEFTLERIHDLDRMFYVPLHE